MNIEHTADPVNVKGFSLANGKQYCFKHFISRHDTLDAFFEVIVKGKICLYSYRNRYFVQKEQEDLLELRNNEQQAFISYDNSAHAAKNEYIGVLKYLLSDSVTNLADLNHIDYGIDIFINLIRTYNEGDKYLEEVKRKRFKPHLSFGLEAGYQIADYEFILSKSKIDSQFGTPVFGPTIKYQFFDHMNLSAGLNCGFIKFSIYKSNAPAQNISYFTLRNNMGIISLPLLLNYDLNQIPLRPHFGLGSSFDKIIVKNFSYSEELSFSNAEIVSSYQHTSQFSMKGSFSFLLNIGCSIPGKSVHYGFNVIYAKQLYGMNDEAKDHISQISSLNFAFSVLF